MCVGVCVYSTGNVNTETSLIVDSEPLEGLETTWILVTDKVYDKS